MVRASHSIISFILYLTIHTALVFSDTLEKIEDNDLENLLSKEEYVVILFCQDDQDERCSNYETELASVREDLVDSLSAWVVKSLGGTFRSHAIPHTEPVIAFFRQQVPVLYDGPANEEILLETLIRYKDHCVQDLTDTSFEHLTQAATGATTGDWLVNFYGNECESCESLDVILETVACKLRDRINVARVNKGSTGAVTSRRFGVGKVPEQIFFRFGKMYRYEFDKLSVESLSSFVTGWYQNVQGTPVPLPKSPFDDFVQLCVDYLRDYPLLFIVMFGIPIILVLSFYLLMSSQESDNRSKKTKMKNSDKKRKKEL